MASPPRFVLMLCCALALVALGCDDAERVGADRADAAALDDPEHLHAAVKKLTDVMIYDIFSPPQASRAYAYASVAAYEALAPGRPGLRSLAGQLNGLEPGPQPPDGGVHLPLASVQAFLRVAEAMVFSEEEIVAYREEVGERVRAVGLPAGLVRRSLAYGDAVAEHVIAWADADGYHETRGGPTFTVTDEPGRWRPTPPAYMDGIEPNWDQLRPFVLDSAAQFRPPPPVPYSMEEGSAFYEQVREVYEIGRDLSHEERAIASFWDCNPYVMHTRGHAMFATKKITPGGHWMGITAIASRSSGLDIAEAAAAYARVAVALADGFISVWEEKYRSNLIRPETVINEFIDEDWTPVLQTPPFPEYTSGHSVISASAATVLTDHFGDGFAFSDTTEVEYGLPVRDFPSFNAAAEEAAVSRLYGGIHYRMAADEGLVQGRNVGGLVVERVRTHERALAARR
ncbi:MAG: vanadium-dependent haloperoxidase [Rhodothermales bacterium]|nr:vanadium-dependent haloperoxidase [Rhodothermales bacterium]